ncbi:DUF2231 domain-containing protein [Nitrosomonas sp. JL21]|uniref:DUF2231 domain-containing protein n=1 Tax=Nitrosomonas sp. JL21 TaxID=153949 RepID=UPI0013721379|nr:DUF2231 domain-containing protein [Nitrosomonas sp. JL21]MBL8497898.1 DUF2231 domain-containing protein [Nitrosomonas sp.]MXS78241.1 DUF2231 domain-containing protein [Nitrosomonas sp. JL21]
MKHPIHPMLVHFPIATWFLATLADLASLFTNEQVGWVAGVLLVIGTITALLAMITGLVELGKIDAQSPAMKIANQHMVLIMTSWSFYAASLFMRLNGTVLEQPGTLAVILSVAGFIFLCSAGWMGGKLVYQYGVGIQPSQQEHSK